MSKKSRNVQPSQIVPSSTHPPGWEQLDGLAKKPTLLALQDGRILEIDGAKFSLFRAQPAPDGVYHLKRSGQLVVRQGILREIVGAPFADAVYSVNP